MKSGGSDEKALKLILKKIKNPFYIFIIVVLYFLNGYIKIIKANEIAIFICIVLICVVLLKDTIYKCVDRWCKRDETIEKERTKRVLKDNGKIDDDDHSSDNKNNSFAIDKSSNTRINDGDIKVYDIKHRRHS